MCKSTEKEWQKRCLWQTVFWTSLTTVSNWR